jgi:type I restriction enzyme M protein
MLTKDNFKNLLLFLDFTETSGVYSKHFAEGNFYLKADFDKSELVYPDALTVNERQTCNFSSNENFVVFECVHRLLAKGYKPEHIELEPKWKSGHGASGGRADIMVRNHDFDPILIIECKTAGREFDKAWRDTRSTGAQLLTYADRERTVKFVCLYAADMENEAVQFEHYIITLTDVPNLVEQYAGKEIKPLFYSAITDVKQWYEVWKDTYNLDYQTNGIFEDDVQAYNIGKQKLRLADLKYITGREMQSKFNEFAEVLRKHNVSSKESAFDKLINLFLCKIVDENQAHHSGKDLDFHWRGTHADDYFSLIDRLQKLYKDGMEMFLGETITFIDNDMVKAAFEYHRDRNATRDRVLHLFKQQKYFTNSDFGFIDVHNDKLFYQNADILLEVVQMWQGYQLNGEQQNQFLSDMFEGFLDKGFKQSEGQFFTPIPICKFILQSLPLAEIVAGSDMPPRVIDYACGSGHFLTEYAKQIKPLVAAQNAALESVAHHKNIKDYYRNIFGVEKEYRLSKVAKMSAFMYGQDEINVIYCDALRDIQQEIRGVGVKVNDDSCDILVANPPFAVNSFLTTLTQKEREKYTLFNKYTNIDSQRNIQCFFIERAKQLLKASGTAAIILPSSVLTNTTDKLFIETRELILKYFDIVSIVQLGSNTFGKTGTVTDVLFLRRKATDTEAAIQYWCRTLDFFEYCDTEITVKGAEYKDIYLLEAYCQHIGILLSDYLSLLRGAPSDALLQQEMFTDYTADFENNNDIKKLKEAKQFKAQTTEAQQAELQKRFVKYLRETEQEKLYYFILAYKNPQKVLLVKSPTDNTVQKKFLGYEWSNAGGREGIKYYGGNTVHDIVTPMFDPKNRENPDKINYYIQQQLKGQMVLEVPQHLQPFIAYTALPHLLDFARKDFNKAFSLGTDKTTKISTQWEVVRIKNMLLKVEGSTEKISNKSITEKGKYPVITQEKGNIIAGYTNIENPITDLPLIVFGDHSCTFKFIDFPFLRGADGTQLLKVDTNYFIPKCFFYLIQMVEIENSDKYERHFKYLEAAKIPLPPLTVQQQIVADCEAIDTAVSKAVLAMEDGKREMERITENTTYATDRLGNITTKINENIDPQTQEGEVTYIGLENIESNTGRLVGTIQTAYATIKSAKTVFKKGDILYGKLRPNLNKVYCAEQDGICSTDILVFRFENENLTKFYTHYFRSKPFNDEVLKSVSGQQLPRTSWTAMREIKIPVPPLAVQTALVAAIETIENKLAAAQAVLDGAAAQKAAVLGRYL